MPLKPTTKSLILSTSTVFINFLTYYLFQLIFIERATINLSIGFTAFVSVIEFILVFIISLLLFKFG